MTATLRLVEDDAPAPVPQHVVIPAASRNAFTELDAHVARLHRMFAGPSTTDTAYAQIGALADEIRVAAERVKRFAR